MDDKRGKYWNDKKRGYSDDKKGRYLDDKKGAIWMTSAVSSFQCVTLESKNFINANYGLADEERVGNGRFFALQRI